MYCRICDCNIHSFVVWCLGLLFFGSCADELDSPLVDSGTHPLEIEAHSVPVTKGLTEGIYLPDQSELGVFVRAVDGSRYEGLSIDNVKYVASGTESSQVWNASGLRTIQLTGTVGKAYAYYPWIYGDYSDMRIPITNDGTDWMYASSAASNLSAGNPVAQFEIVHAMSIIRCRISKGDYTSAGTVTTVGVKSHGLASGGIMDLEACSVTNYVDPGEEIVQKDPGSLSAEGLSVDLWAVSTGVSNPISFRVVVDGTMYRVTSEDLTLDPGMIYNFSMILNDETLELASVTYDLWGESPNVDYEPGLTDLWSEARKVDGVYAIDMQGNPVAYADVVDDQYLGAAFVVKGKAYQVAHKDAVGPDGSNNVYWCLENYVDIPELYNFRTYYDKAGTGPINDTQLPEDISTWTVGAVSDFDGAWNTEIIIKSQTTDDVVADNTISKSLIDFRADPELNQGHHDWFIPAFGELTFMTKNRNQLNDLLSRVGGVQFSNVYYVSSTERVKAVVYGANLGTGMLNTLYKTNSFYYRFIRLL